MRFPRVRAFVPSSSHSIGSPATFWDSEMGFLEKLIMLSSDVTTEKMVCISTWLLSFCPENVYTLFLSFHLSLKLVLFLCNPLLVDLFPS